MFRYLIVNRAGSIMYVLQWRRNACKRIKDLIFSSTLLAAVTVVKCFFLSFFPCGLQQVAPYFCIFRTSNSPYFVNCTKYFF